MCEGILTLGNIRKESHPLTPGTCAWMSMQLAAAAHLEAAMMEHTYLNSKPAELLLDKAFDLLKIRLELTGVMGKRTQHQVRTVVPCS